MEKAVEQLNKVFNLSKYEARLYLSALNYEQVNLTDLARRANIPRTAAYEPLKSLLRQGFLSAVKLRKRTYYRALDPKQLKFILERRQTELSDMVANLEKQISIPERKLAITYYDGVDGVRVAADIFMDEARTKKGKSWENLDETVMMHGGAQLYEYIKKRVKKGIFGEMIAPADSKHPYIKDRLAHDKAELRKTILVNPKKYPLKASIGVIDDLVMIFTSGDNPFAVLIKNKDVATTMWSIHEMYWDRYNI